MKNRAGVGLWLAAEMAVGLVGVDCSPRAVENATRRIVKGHSNFPSGGHRKFPTPAVMNGVSSCGPRTSGSGVPFGT